MHAHGEDHYALSTPDTVEHVSSAGRRRVVASATWCWPGAGRNTTAAVLLSDASGREVDRDLADAFARDVLDHHGGARHLVIAIREVHAWLAEREPEVRAHARTTPAPTTLPEMLARRDAGLRGGTRSHWLAVFRAVHGPPDVPVDGPVTLPASQRQGED